MWHDIASSYAARALSVITVLQAKSQEAVVLPQRACTAAPFRFPSSSPKSVELGSRASVAILLARAPFGSLDAHCSLRNQPSNYACALIQVVALRYITEDATRSLTKYVLRACLQRGGMRLVAVQHRCILGPSATPRGACPQLRKQTAFCQTRYQQVKMKAQS